MQDTPAWDEPSLAVEPAPTSPAVGQMPAAAGTGASVGEHEPSAHSGPAEAPPTYVPSWQPLDIDQLLDDGYQGPQPTLWPVGGGHHWLYPGSIHTIFAQPGTFKSYLTLWGIAQEMNRGSRCLLVDAEEHASVAVHRLRKLGATPEQLRSQFAIVEPAANPHTEAEYGAFGELAAGGWDVVVIDSVTRTGSLSGIKSNDQDSVTHWFESVPNAFARRGAAVVVVDHVPKPSKDAAEGSERYAGGSNAKLGIVQVAIRLSPTDAEQPRPGIVGRVRATVTKDRHAGIVQHGDAWDVEVDSTDEDHVRVTVHAIASAAPATDDDRDAATRAAVIRALQHNPPGLGVTALRKEAVLWKGQQSLGREPGARISAMARTLATEGIALQAVEGKAMVTRLTDDWMDRCRQAGIPIPELDSKPADVGWDPDADLGPAPTEPAVA